MRNIRATLGGDGGAERLGEGVDLLAAAALGERDQEAVLELGVLAAERVTGGDSALRAAVEDGADRGVEADRELADDRRRVQQLDPVDRGQGIARVGGATG